MTGGFDHLSRQDFARLAAFIHDYSGIKMPPTKQTMVEGRLRKRVSAHGFANLSEYCSYIFDAGGLQTEAIHLIDVVTTNKTEFFREPEHFRFLVDVAMPGLLAGYRAGSNPLIKVWCTASSIGAEPYTLAMVMHNLSRGRDNFRTSILATDISTRVLETAAIAIYPESMIEPVPLDMRKKYLLRSKDPAQQTVRLVPEIRRLARFGRVNLMDDTYPVDSNMDIIFCRNMLIYFDKPTQQMVLTRLCSHLRPGGYMFLGHSETLAGFGLPLNPVGPTVFRHE